MIALEVGDCALVLDPALGGAVSTFNWHDLPIFRSACGPSVLDGACFPLVPFSNRIADGRFKASGYQVQLKPNFPGSDHPHPLHGFGWLSKWDATEVTKNTVVLEHYYSETEWPWPYLARQRFALAQDCLTIDLSIRNLGQTPMPCGLGLHPYFPCNDETLFYSLHEAEVVVDRECVPVGANISDMPHDYWRGAPVAGRHVDTTYLDRHGPLQIQWPDKETEVVVEPSANLAHTVIYTPPEEDFFCVEPVSHVTNSFNALVSDAGGHIMLAPDQDYSASCRFSVRAIS